METMGCWLVYECIKLYDIYLRTHHLQQRYTSLQLVISAKEYRKSWIFCPFKVALCFIIPTQGHMYCHTKKVICPVIPQGPYILSYRKSLHYVIIKGPYIMLCQRVIIFCYVKRFYIVLPLYQMCLIFCNIQRRYILSYQKALHYISWCLTLYHYSINC